MKNRLMNRDELLLLISVISHPKEHGLTQAVLEGNITDFCAGCPDPLGAYRLIAECDEALSDGELVTRALDMPSRDIVDIPMSVVPADHPARA